MTRPKREELLLMARRREIDAILVWKLDRFGRSLADLVTTLNEQRELDVVFVSLTESLDFSTPSGRAMAAGMLSTFAEFERDIIRERVKAGLPIQNYGLRAKKITKTFSDTKLLSTRSNIRARQPLGLKISGVEFPDLASVKLPVFFV